MEVKLVHITPNAEATIAYCARVSSPENQANEECSKLLRYCIKHSHWSIFEMANMCLEIITSRAISAQILRHRSFSFQEFSQRYAKVQSFERVWARRQDNKNRQNSIDNMSKEDKDWFNNAQDSVNGQALELYEDALDRGIAKEQARFLLPMSSQTTVYMNGSIRSWITYINLRSENGTQKEHQDIALQCKQIFCQQLPIISAALDWNKPE